MQPDISVLLPLYKEPVDYAQKAIDSILEQDYKCIEIIVILDNPDNFELKELMKAYLKADSRIIFQCNEVNLGLPSTLNRALKMASGKYIARMDGDDVSEKERLRVQYEYMEEHPDIVLCGTASVDIDENDKIIYRNGKRPERSEMIARSMRYANVFVHPSFFVRAEILRKFQYRNLTYAQDNDLTCRLLERGYKLANINQYLVRHRVDRMTDEKLYEQRLTAMAVRRFYKKSRLNEVDIVGYVEKKRRGITQRKVKNYALGNESYVAGVKFIKKKKYLTGIRYFIKCFFQSRMQAHAVLDAICYIATLRIQSFWDRKDAVK